MDIIQLQYFQILAKVQHMTKAAGILNISQPALSRSLRNLETELDVRLFDRVGKYIYLNDYGKILLKHVDVAIQELENAKRELKDRQGREEQTVTLLMYAGSKLLPDLIRGFKEKYPDITLNIFQQDRGEENRIISDITVYSSSKSSNEPNSAVLMQEDICLALPTEHALSKRASIKLQEVSGESFICLHKGKGLRVVTDEMCHMVGFEPNIILESDSPATVRDLISVGVGLAFIPRISWRGMDNDPKVTLVKIDEPNCSRFIIMNWREEHYFSKSASKLRDYLIDFFKRAADTA